MREVVIVPTFHREELLFCCLKRIRATEPNIEIHVFPDRGTFYDSSVRAICEAFKAVCHLVPDNDWYGNTANTMNAYLWAYNAGYDRIFYVESDVMVHADFFSWHREQQEEFDIFASMAWIFNRHAPISDDLLFQSWFYSIGVCFAWEKLALIVPHATPKYYGDMAGYIERNFKDSNLNVPLAVAHFEQDGLIQRVLDRHKGQTVCPGIAKCSHVGFKRSYGGDSQDDYEKFLGLEGLRFDECVKRVEEFIADEYWRAQVFGRDIVEREIGHVLQKREFTYRIKIGEFESTFKSELTQGRLPRRINSVVVTPEAKIVVL